MIKELKVGKLYKVTKKLGILQLADCINGYKIIQKLNNNFGDNLILYLSTTQREVGDNVVTDNFFLYKNSAVNFTTYSKSRLMVDTKEYFFDCLEEIC